MIVADSCHRFDELINSGVSLTLEQGKFIFNHQKNCSRHAFDTTVEFPSSDSELLQRILDKLKSRKATDIWAVQNSLHK